MVAWCVLNKIVLSGGGSLQIIWSNLLALLCINPRSLLNSEQKIQLLILLRHYHHFTSEETTTEINWSALPCTRSLTWGLGSVLESRFIRFGAQSHLFTYSALLPFSPLLCSNWFYLCYHFRETNKVWNYVGSLSTIKFPSCFHDKCIPNLDFFFSVKCSQLHM